MILIINIKQASVHQSMELQSVYISMRSIYECGNVNKESDKKRGKCTDLGLAQLLKGAGEE